MQTSLETRSLKIIQVIAEKDAKEATQVVRISRNQEDQMKQVMFKKPKLGKMFRMVNNKLFRSINSEEVKKVKNGDAQS